MSKAKAITNQIVSNQDTQRTIFKVLVGSIIMLSIIYVYLIGSITFNILARKSLENTVKTLGSQISNMELTYLSRSNQIDKNYATSLGFVETNGNSNIFATRETTPRVAIR